MGRKRRQELTYFPLDSDWDQDEDIQLLEIEFGNQASSLYLKLISRIYREKKSGWWKKWNKDIEMLFAKDINEKYKYVHEVVQGCLRRGLFDKSVFEMFGVLTSEAIQRRYIDIVNQLGRKDVVIVLEYWVLDESFDSFSRIEPILKSITSDENSITSDEKGKPPDDMHQREKEKEKEKESENKYCAREAVRLKDSEYDKLCEQHGKPFVEQCLDKLNNYKLSKGKKYKSDYRAILSWVIQAVQEDQLQNQQKNGTIDAKKISDDVDRIFADRARVKKLENEAASTN